MSTAERPSDQKRQVSTRETIVSAWATVDDELLRVFSADSRNGSASTGQSRMLRKTAPDLNEQVRCRYRWVWQVLGSNQRLADGFTDLSSCSSLMPPSCGYVIRGGIWDGHRPLCVRGRWVSGSERSTDRGGTGHGRARTSPRTSTDQPTDRGGKGHGRGRWERLRRPSTWLLAFDLAFHGFPTRRRRRKGRDAVTCAASVQVR